MALSLPARRVVQGVAGLALLAILGGIVADLRGFGRTRCGQAPPHADFTGAPIEWSNVETTPTGMRRKGWVIDFLADCTTGMIHGRILGIRIPFRPFSERAIVLHGPREACAARGFTPQFRCPGLRPRARRRRAPRHGQAPRARAGPRRSA
jgi:hypothetical protein